MNNAKTIERFARDYCEHLKLPMSNVYIEKNQLSLWIGGELHIVHCNVSNDRHVPDYSSKLVADYLDKLI